MFSIFRTNFFNDLSADKLREYYISCIRCKSDIFSEEEKKNEVFIKEVMSAYIDNGVEILMRTDTKLPLVQFTFRLAENDMKDNIIDRYFSLAKCIKQIV